MTDRRDAGDTLFEILVAITIIAIAGVAVIVAFGTSIGASSEESNLSQFNAILKSYSATVISENQNSTSFYISCGTASQYNAEITGLPTWPTNYTVKLFTVAYWSGTTYSNGTDFSSSSCPSGSTEPELLTATATYTKTGQTASLSFALSDFSFVQPVETTPAFTDGSSYTLPEGSGTAWSYTVTTSSGSPAPDLTISSGTLPSGVTFVNNGDGTGTLSGTTSVTAGTYTFTINANNSYGTSANLAFTLEIIAAPVITSASSISWVASSTDTYTLTATDTGDLTSPSLALDTTLSGALKNFTWRDNGNGTGTFTGTLASGYSGVSYQISFEADGYNGVTVNQTVTFWIPTAPVFTSSSSVTWTEGSTVSFEVSAADIDVSSPTLSLATSLTGALTNLTFVSGSNGTGTLSGTLESGVVGSYSLTFDAINSASQTSTQSFTAYVVAAPVFAGTYSYSETSGATVTLTGTVSDVGDAGAPTVTWSASSSQLSNLTYSTTTSGTTTTWKLTGSIVAGNGIYTGTLTAKNSLGTQSTEQVTVYTPTTPVFAGTYSYGETSGASVTLTGTASDADDSAAPTVTWSATSSQLANLTLSTTTSGSTTTWKLTGTLVAGNGDYTGTLTAKNSLGTQATQTLSVYTPTAPVFAGTYSYTEASGATVNLTGTVSDSDDSSYPTVTWTPISSQLDNLVLTTSGSGSTTTWTLKGTLVSGVGTYTGTLTATNSAGVRTTKTVTITT